MRRWEQVNWMLDRLFPAQQIFARSFPFWKEFLLFLALTVLFSMSGFLLPAEGLIGFDWQHFWGQDRIAGFYPPWVLPIIRPLTWPLLVGLSMAAFSLAVLRRFQHPLSGAAAFFCLPLFWTIFLGQLEGLVTLGLLWLPWLTPLALMKPQVSIFALGARRSYLLGFLVMIALSLIIWGNWPARTLAVESYYAEGRYPQNIGLGWWGLPFALAAFWFSRGDMDMLMAAGSMISPHLIPYNLLPLTPAVARLRPRTAWVAVLFSWLPFSANWLGPTGWWLGWLFVVWLWLALAARRYPNAFRSPAIFQRKTPVTPVVNSSAEHSTNRPLRPGEP